MVSCGLHLVIWSLTDEMEDSDSRLWDCLLQLDCLLSSISLPVLLSMCVAQSFDSTSAYSLTCPEPQMSPSPIGPLPI